MSQVSAFYWGTNFENILNFSYPFYDVIPERVPRDGSDFVQGVSGVEDAWITGWDHTLDLEARYLQLGAQSDFSAGPGGQGDALGGAASVQGFLDWARAKNTFRFVPDYLNAPGFYVDGCYLADQVKGGGGGRGLTSRLDWTQKLKIRNPTMDFALALRGLMFEYAPGGDLTTASIARNLAGEYITGYALAGFTGVAGLPGPIGVAGMASAAVNVLRDRHYPLGSSLRTTLVERAQTNSCLQSQALATSPWVSTLITATNNANKAPDLSNTATNLVPNGTSSNGHNASQPITITSGEFIAASGCFQRNGYSGIIFRFGDAGSTNGFQATVDLAAGTIMSNSIGFGSGVLTGSQIIGLPGGWYYVKIWGAVNAAVTAGNVFAFVYDTGAHANTTTAFAGNGTSGVLAWGIQVERNGATSFPPSSYIATTTATVTRGSDSLSFPFTAPPQPMFMYIKYVEGGDRYGGQGNTFTMQIGNLSATGRVLLDNGAGAVAAFFQPTSGSVSSAVTLTPSVGDVVEDMLVLAFSGGGLTVQARRSINGGAESAGGVSGVLVPDGAWGLLAVQLGADAAQGSTSFGRGIIRAMAGPLVYAGQTINTIALARAA